MSHSSHSQEIVRVDSKGRITIPSYMRGELGMQEGSYAAVRINRNDRSLSVNLFAGARAKLVEMRLMIPDRPGALARAARSLSELKLDLLASNSRTLKKGDAAEWVVVADISEAGRSPEDIRKKVLENRDATSIEVKELSD
jgi:AbrB family looped-hinge helix DNA binding protein